MDGFGPHDRWWIYAFRSRPRLVFDARVRNQNEALINSPAHFTYTRNGPHAASVVNAEYRFGNTNKLGPLLFVVI
jgi:hypothetical protein